MKLPDVGATFVHRPADDDDIDSRFDDANYAADAVDQLNRRLDLLTAEVRSLGEMLAERIAQGFKRVNEKLDDYADASANEARERKRLAEQVAALESAANSRPKRARK